MASTHPAPQRAESRFFVGPETMPVDETGWWERERATYIRSRVESLTWPNDVVVDVGCGRGTMFDTSELADRTCIAVDGHIWPVWKRSSHQLFVCADADALPFREGAFDLVGSFDVLEHLPDDGAGIAEQRRIVRRSGHVVTAVPADPRLWSAHDDAVGHQRRYTPDAFIQTATANGISPDRVSHFFTFLWLPAWLLRHSAARRTEPATSASAFSRLAQRVIGLVCRVERRLLDRVSLPFGTSLWIESTPND